MMRHDVIAFSEQDKMAELVAQLTVGRYQFAVCMFPQDMNAPVHTGWVVSYPVSDPGVVSAAA